MVLLLAVRQPGLRPLALGELVHEGVGGLERVAGLLALVVEGVGAGGDGGRQGRRGGGPVPGDVTGPFEERLKNLREGRAYCAAGHPVDAREGALRSYDAVRAQLPVLLELLGDRDPEIRTKTAYLLGWFPEEADAILLPLLACLDGEGDPVCVATFLVAVGLLADHDPDGRVRHHLDHEHPLPRWAAATALTRLLVAHPAAAPGLPPAERIAAELAAFGAGPALESATAHHAGDLHSYTVRSLLHLMGATEDPDGVLLEIVRALPHLEKTGVVPRPLAVRAENLLEALFEPTDTTTVFTELSPGRQKLLKVLAELLTAEDFQPVPFGSDLHEQFTQYGLPGTRPALRAYVGLSTEGEDPSAPLPDPWEQFRTH